MSINVSPTPPLISFSSETDCFKALFFFYYMFSYVYFFHKIKLRLANCWEGKRLVNQTKEKKMHRMGRCDFQDIFKGDAKVK